MVAYVELAEYASLGKPPYHMRLMNSDDSWNLLHRKVFNKECSSPEFEKIGKQIALKCGGLPLAITVIAGLLSKIGRSLYEWQSVAENVSSEVSTDVDVQCMRVLALSYYYLPHHLKACFIYFAIFPEDKQIYVEELVELWTAEGFLKLEEMKSIEEVAEKCLKDLIDRSLISICHLSFDGKIKSCGMHDLTREFCLMEARNMNFVIVLGGKSDQNPYAQSLQFFSKSRGRISIHNEEDMSRCRNSEAHSVILFGIFQCFVLELPFKLIRVLDLASISYPTFPSGILSLIHLRYLALCLYPSLKQYLGCEKEVPSSIIDIPPLISSLFYMKTFILNLPNHVGRQYPHILPSEILTMPQLRQLCLDWNYLRNHEPTEKSLVKKHLKCLSGLNPWYCTVSFFRLYPNLKKLQVHGVLEDFQSCKDLYDFRYLDQLEELELKLSYGLSSCFYERITLSGSTLQNILQFQKKTIHLPPAVILPPLLLPPADAFPQNLKSLAFDGHIFLAGKDLSIVGKLPKLESLKLSYNSYEGNEWEVVEEGFPSLKFLRLKYSQIRYWRATSDHFPCLERLFLVHCWFLDSIHHDFAEITTLKLIDVKNCAQSVGISAKKIQQDIQDNYGGVIEVHIRHTLVDHNASH